jgi:hypothetical protein
MLYKGSCHCGKVAFEFEGELNGALRCNCSICARKGALLFAMPHQALHVVAWGDDLGTYTFGNHVISHRFCRTCGIHPFAEDASHADGRNAYVNLRCVEELDLASLPMIDFDGRAV